MSETKPLSAKDKIAKLRATFLTQLPERAAHARELFEQVKADPGNHAAAVDLHRSLHSIKGTGRSFGFREVGAAAEPGEDLAAILTESPVASWPANWQQQLAAHLNQMEAAVAAACVSVHGNEPGFSLPPVSGQSAAVSDGRRMIYICDDEVLTLEQLAHQLRCFGYEIVTFTEPKTLHEAVLARRPDAVIMDINFPQGRDAGTKVMAKLQAEAGSHIPAIFLSARDDFAARLAAVQAGSEAYFHKPTRAIDIVATLDGLTRQEQPDPYRILIIDDEVEIADYHSIILQEAGMITRQLSDPAHVLEVLQEFRPDMVLMDMYMPRCSGHDLAKLIRQIPEYVSLPIVFLSSETDRKKQFSAMRIGAEGFLTKPVVPEDMISAVVIRAERMRALRSLMARDSLTGLFNHSTTTQLLENAISNAKRGASTLCFAMIDIDDFKSVNDTHGHPVGDQVIMALSRVLQQRLRNSDVVGRYGGEEFAVILQDVSPECAAKLLDELRQDFSRVIFHSASAEFTCTFSAGIAAYPAYDSMETLREMADKALYKAKRSGRNRVVTDKGEQGSQ
ncbi:MAG TPA: diguanylate cyclase [Gallionella sp.]|nr:diguanylate cyclase [Gallionella sp.]